MGAMLTIAAMIVGWVIGIGCGMLLDRILIERYIS